ncbi:ExbD/TolR family protein [Alkalilacustris brevis]|uniref:ExbD/TolR family protein n=1 Tax=Alkalilacustris brevis TaxID=2026338 RepID=UPI000E0D285E|nr:biopolymer transporter ExbD [Alkalilacustris brevis]
MQIFARPRPRPARESAVPMINIVFLLLIFFLMSAQIAPPEPFDVSPPEAQTQLPEAGRDPDALYLGADGRLAFGPARDEAVWPALAARDEAPLVLRVDAAAPGAELAAVLARLSGLGIARVSLITQGGGPG